MSGLSLLASGSNAQGQLATGDAEDAHILTPCLFDGCSPGQLPEGTTAITSVACGANHTLLLLARSHKQELWGCGDRRRGQLGPSYTPSARVGSWSGAVFRPLDLHVEGLPEFAPRLVAAGWETSYVVFSCQDKSDMLISMGADDFGNLGVGGVKGTTAAGRSLHVVPLLSAFADADMENVILSVQSLNSGPHHVVTVVKLTSADGSTNHGVIGWGTARHGQLGGAPANASRPSPFYATPHSICLDETMMTLGPIKHAALGNQHSVFLHASRRLSGLGSNRKSQRELLETVEDAHDVACTWNGTYAVCRDGAVDRVVATGSNSHGQLGRGDSEASRSLTSVNFPLPTPSLSVVKLACGSEHVLCLLEVKSEGDVRRERSRKDVASAWAQSKDASGEYLGRQWNKLDPRGTMKPPNERGAMFGARWLGFPAFEVPLYVPLSAVGLLEGEIELVPSAPRPTPLRTGATSIRLLNIYRSGGGPGRNYQKAM
ncbi:regulator of chromosome condensation 1/beta-lactamase-inhibitor protein II [Rhodofomes roseus]|uniref:Regulator of chromosome condensation 1/beta-lactamase-inhibitor protein II n=1 Tax=Rhodofomes roseus TaxID=34475 RepID=A0ABQ8K132_9APHY|nr:regulator of chromosome condensation 1/beta-lactamase-inhibitor protein II [Rhodofomes roseus]KAH9830404.1 regulator of chromosome condensation 1/beta-lactamase-inhibitor protein II [Rhodofomes roseus]